MGETIQLAVVFVVVAIAAVYAGRRILGQLTRSEDEAAGCSGCEANPASKAMRGQAHAGGGQIVRIGDRTKR